MAAPSRAASISLQLAAVSLASFHIARQLTGSGPLRIPATAAPGEAWPGAVRSGAVMVTPDPNADAQAGAEADGDGAVLAAVVVG